MTDHPFGAWLDSDRTGPVPEPVPAPEIPNGQYWLSADDGMTRLWCHPCTAGGDDYLGEWGLPTTHDEQAALSAMVREHQADKHATEAEGQRP